MLFGNDEYDSMLFYFADCITYVCLIRHGKSQKKSLLKVPEKIAGSKDGKFMVPLFYNTISRTFSSESRGAEGTMPPQPCENKS